MTGHAKVNILFFGQLKQVLNCARLEWPVTQAMTIAELKQQLMQQSDSWQVLAEEQVLSALNQTLCAADARVNAGDEVAFFPPVTGG